VAAAPICSAQPPAASPACVAPSDCCAVRRLGTLSPDGQYERLRARPLRRGRRERFVGFCCVAGRYLAGNGPSRDCEGQQKKITTTSPGSPSARSVPGLPTPGQGSDPAAATSQVDTAVNVSSGQCLAVRAERDPRPDVIAAPGIGQRGDPAAGGDIPQVDVPRPSRLPPLIERHIPILADDPDISRRMLARLRLFRFMR
jgi:hypothetical protein